MTLFNIKSSDYQYVYRYLRLINGTGEIKLFIFNKVIRLIEEEYEVEGLKIVLPDDNLFEMILDESAHISVILPTSSGEKILEVSELVRLTGECSVAERVSLASFDSVDEFINLILSKERAKCNS